MRVILNDFHHVAQSGLYAEPVKFKFNLWSYEDPEETSNIYMFPIKAKLVFSAEKLMSASNSIEITNLRQKKYFIEVKYEISDFFNLKFELKLISSSL
jgi:hypothetical protein